MLTAARLSSFLQKIDALRWTQHMDECLQILIDRKECVNDEFFIEQLRLQRIVENITNERRNNGHLDSTAGEASSLCVENFRLQLEGLKTGLLDGPQLENSKL